MGKFCTSCGAALNEDEAAFLEAAEEQYLASQRPMRRSPFFRR